MLISLVPGLRPERYERLIEATRADNRQLDGVVITTPGVGNIPSIEPYNFRPLIQRAVNLGIPVLITSQVPINPFTQAQYEMARVPEEYGAILTGNLTFAAAMTKFAWVIGCVRHEMPDASPGDKRHEIAKRMKENYVGELGEYEARTASRAQTID
jgi:L-asparaginase/Glu-tRNA(Gln) amidotransferase subunit D